MDRLSSENGFFTDSKGYVILLRGVNLAGSSKIPVKPDGTTQFDQSESFLNHKSVSFVGRPFPENQAEEHFSRLKKWGFNFLRFLVTWEAIEHKGPGKYDEEYLNYIARMVKLAEKKGFYLFIDPHQDVWSRFTGGDGAPGWLFDEIGMDMRKFGEAGLSIVQHEKGNEYQKMVWPLNYQKYPTASMFTLFFGGNVFAPASRIHGKRIQDFLQDHYINSILKLARKLSKFKNVVGFDSLNEPSPGFIARKNLREFSGFGFGKTLASTPFQEMYMSEGHSANADIRFMIGLKGVTIGKKLLNPDQISIWKEKNHCVWRKHGVWDFDPNGAPMLLKPDYFYKVNGKKIAFFNDFMKPFIISYKNALQKVNKSFFIFIESDPTELDLNWSEENPKGHATVVNATHWYDPVLLLTKKYYDWFAVHTLKRTIVFGKVNAREVYENTIKMIRDHSKAFMQNCPTVIGETGIPMDLNDRIAFKRKDYSLHKKALDAIMNAVDRNLVNVTLWNYTPDNTHTLGDRWNDEDLSIFSKDTQPSVDADGGRATAAFSRPYPVSTRGIPVSLSFDMEKGLFKYSFKKGNFSNPECAIFIPEIHYRTGFKVLHSAGSYEYNLNDRILRFKGDKKTDLFGITILPEK
ncbi:MAG: cellulase family glycosylhydrolase [Leptospira sp.]|nr:cellulase family glycosylhydrolase [Leptospira sp.]